MLNKLFCYSIMFAGGVLGLIAGVSVALILAFTVHSLTGY